MNFGDAATRVKETGSLNISDDTRVREFLNEAIVDFARDASTNPIRFTFNTVIGQTDYDITTAAVSANGVLRFLLGDDMDEGEFEIRGLATLVLPTAPTSVAAITGWIVPRPALISTAGGAADLVVLPFPREYHRAVVYRALQLAFEWDRQDISDVQMWEAKYEAEVGKARRQRTRASGKSQRLRPSASLNQSSGWWW